MIIIRLLPNNTTTMCEYIVFGDQRSITEITLALDLRRTIKLMEERYSIRSYFMPFMRHMTNACCCTEESTDIEWK